MEHIVLASIQCVLVWRHLDMEAEAPAGAADVFAAVGFGTAHWLFLVEGATWPFGFPFLAASVGWVASMLSKARWSARAPVLVRFYAIANLHALLLCVWWAIYTRNSGKEFFPEFSDLKMFGMGAHK